MHEEHRLFPLDAQAHQFQSFLFKSNILFFWSVILKVIFNKYSDYICIKQNLPSKGGVHPLESSIQPFTPSWLVFDATQEDPLSLSPTRMDDAVDGLTLCAGPRTDAPRPSLVATLMIWYKCRRVISSWLQVSCICRPKNKKVWYCSEFHDKCHNNSDLRTSPYFSGLNYFWIQYLNVVIRMLCLLHIYPRVVNHDYVYSPSR